MKRRDFFRQCAKGLMLVPFLGVIAKEAQAVPDSPVSPTDPVAGALGYVNDATTTDTTKYPKRAGAEGAKQFCENCMFFQGNAKQLSGQNGTWAQCTLFQTGLVNSKGWCNSWAVKS